MKKSILVLVFILITNIALAATSFVKEDGKIYRVEERLEKQEVTVADYEERKQALEDKKTYIEERIARLQGFIDEMNALEIIE